MIFRNNLKSTIRRLLRDKTYLLVNMLSLTAGLLCCLFIFKYVQHEISYDKFHKDSERIYRMELEVFTEDGGSSRYAYLGTSPVDWIDNIPEIEQETRLARYSGDMGIEARGESFTENKMFAADGSFFELFSFEFIQGSSNGVFANPNSVVVSQSTAQKYFNNTNVVGETLVVRFREQEETITISGVIEDVPSNSHFSFDMLTSVNVYEKLYGVQIRNFNNAYSYIKASQNSSLLELGEKINEFYQQYSPEEASVSRFHLRPITEIHLHSTALGELSSNGNAVYVYLFAFIGFLILGISCTNFVTLTTARSVTRALEMGMRKVFGANKSSLISAFLIESILLSLIGLSLTYLLAWYLLPYFNSLAGKSFYYSDLFATKFFLLMLAVAVLTGTISSIYPAVALSGQKTRFLLKKNVTGKFQGNIFWKSMIVIQLAITILMISGTYIIHKQIHFIFAKDLGFDKEQVITLPNYFDKNVNLFIDQLEQNPNIEETTTSIFTPGANTSVMTTSVVAEGITSSMTFDVNVVGYNFFNTYSIPINQGRNFSEQLASDSTQAFILNEAAVKSLGWSNPLGKEINAWGRDGYVIGVVNDFHFVSLHSEIAPTVFLTYGRPVGWLSVKTQSADLLPQTLTFIEDKWNKFFPGTPFIYNFVDDQFAAVYESEQRAQSLFFSFSILAILIAVLGLFSFASYTVRQKTREIGIRKVLGASVSDILKQFYTGYFKLLFFAGLIALPVGYIWMTNWLQNFSYRTAIEPGAFAIPLIIAFLILVLSVSYQVVKGAYQNPAESIRSE